MKRFIRIAAWMLGCFIYVFAVPYGIQFLKPRVPAAASALAMVWLLFLIALPMYFFSKWAARRGATAWAKRLAKPGLLLWLGLIAAYPLLHFGTRLGGTGRRAFIAAIYLTPFVLGLYTFLFLWLWIFTHLHSRGWVNLMRYVLVSFFSLIVFLILLVGIAPYTP